MAVQMVTTETALQIQIWSILGQVHNGRRGNSRNGTNAFGGQLKATTMTPLISQCTDVVYILLISGPTQLKALLILTGQGRTLEEGTIRNRGSRDLGSLRFF